ncbi:MAG: DUF2608 domain-containing protein [Verrucomicrobia bacterium]|nr:DUF2608 domain-containing protein [Verrucomicrobiota bacterium]
MASLSSALYRADSFQPFFSVVESFTEKSLVVLDVDRVLIEPKDAIMRLPNQRLLWELRQKYGSHLSQQEHANLSSLVTLQEGTRLIDPRAVEFINHCKAKNIPIIALTATAVTGFGKIRSVPDWRVNDLARLSIEFSTLFSDCTLTQVNGKGPSPVCKNGIIFTGGYSKGDVLEAFLDTVGFMPDKVLFVDDLLYNLYSVQNSLDDMGVEDIRVYHFLGADKIPNTIDVEKADRQIKTLIEEQTWIPDDSAVLERNVSAGAADCD